METGVYFAAVVEYLAAECLELGGQAARDSNRCRITPVHMDTAIMNDLELT